MFFGCLSRFRDITRTGHNALLLLKRQVQTLDVAKRPLNMQGRRPRALSGGRPALRGPRVRRGLPVGTHRPCCRVVASAATYGLLEHNFVEKHALDWHWDRTVLRLFVVPQPSVRAAIDYSGVSPQLW